MASVHPYQPKCHGNGDIDGDGDPSMYFSWTNARGITEHGDDCNDTDPNENASNNERANGFGWDRDCDDTTGGVRGYDPKFLDPRGDSPNWISSGFRRWRGNPQRLVVSGFGGNMYDCFNCIDNDEPIDLFPRTP